jgi:DNA-binding CsgD family transcriptional regulator
MTPRHETILSSLQSVKALDELQPAIALLRDIFEVDHLVYHSLSNTGEHFGALTYDPAWVERYLDLGYARIDPVIQGCASNFQPFDWQMLDWSPRKAQGFLSEAVDAGVGAQGLTVPIRGPGGQFALFTASSGVTDTEWTRYTRDALSELVLCGHFVNQKFLDLARDTDAQPMRRLSPRELDALSYLATGNSRAQAAESLRISEHTLRVYIEAARLKLGAQNTTHAVARALSLGLIHI